MEFGVDINNNPDLISNVLDIIFSLIAGVIDTMQEIKLFAGVSLFNFCVAVTIMTIVITYLVNVAKRPYSESGSEASKRIKRKNDENFNPSDYL